MILFLPAVKTEDTSKFSSIYYEYKNLMANRAYDILNDKGLAEDAVQNAFLKILKSINCVDEVKSTRTKCFVVIVTENCAKDIYRKERRERELELDYDERADYLEDEIEVKLSVEEIKRRIRKLPDIYSDTLLLKYFNDLSDKDIASALSVSVAAVRKSLLRGKKMLLKEVAENE